MRVTPLRLVARPLVLVLAAGALAAGVPVTAGAAVTAVPFEARVTSEYDSLYGTGGSLAWDPSTATATAAVSAGTISLDLVQREAAYGPPLRLVLRPATDGSPGWAAGVHEDLTDVPTDTRPGFEVAQHASCPEQVSSRVEVLDLVVADGVLQRLHVAFDQRCGDRRGATVGEVRYGAAAPAAPAVFPTRVSWAPTFPGATAPGASVTIRNTSGQPMTFGAPTVAGGPFTASLDGGFVPCPQTVEPGAACYLRLGFAPTAAGEVASTVTVPTSAGAVVVPVRGEGVAGHSGFELHGDVVDGYYWDRYEADPPGSQVWARVADDGFRVDGYQPGQHHLVEVSSDEPLEAGRSYPAVGTGVEPEPGTVQVWAGQVQYDNSCETGDGWLTVHELSSAPEDTRVSATFSLLCEGEEGIRGSVAYRAGAPAQPVPAPGEWPDDSTPIADADRTDLVALTGLDEQLWVKAGTEGWQPMGGRLVDTPALVPLPDGDVLLIGVGGDRNLWARTLDSGWRRFAPVGTSCTGPSGVVTDAGVVVGCRGSDGQLWVGTSPLHDLGVRSWRPLGGQTAHGVNLFDVGQEAPQVGYLVVGGDGRPWYRTDASAWGPASEHRCGGAATTAYWGDATACRNSSDESLKTFHGASGVNGTVIGGRMVGRPGVAVDPDGVARYYVLGGDRSVWVASQRADGSPVGFAPFGGAGLYGVAALSLT